MEENGEREENYELNDPIARLSIKVWPYVTDNWSKVYDRVRQFCEWGNIDRWKWRVDRICAGDGSNDANLSAGPI